MAKIDYNKPLEFLSLDPFVQRTVGDDRIVRENTILLEGKVSIMWDDIIAVEEFNRRMLVANDSRPLTIIRTRFTPNGYIAIAQYDEVYSAWEVYLSNNRLGLGNFSRFN